MISSKFEYPEYILIEFKSEYIFKNFSNLKEKFFGVAVLSKHQAGQSNVEAMLNENKKLCPNEIINNMNLVVGCTLRDIGH